MEPKYDIDYFIAKFAAIPDDQWTTEEFTDGNGCKCALGHCGLTPFSQGVNPEVQALVRIVAYPARVNDGNEEYARFGSTPKERILNALKAAKELE